jgi:hypothetical protein
MSKSRRSRHSSPRRKTVKRKSHSPRSPFKSKHKSRKSIKQSVQRTLIKSSPNSRECQIDMMKRLVYTIGSQAKSAGVLDWNTDPTKMANDIGLFFSSVEDRQRGGVGTPPKLTSQEIRDLQEEVKTLREKDAMQIPPNQYGEPCSWDQLIMSLLIILAIAWGGWEVFIWACERQGQQMGAPTKALADLVSKRIAAMHTAAEAALLLDSPDILRATWQVIYDNMKVWFTFRGADLDLGKSMAGNRPGEGATYRFVLTTARRICSILPKKSVSVPFTFLWGLLVGLKDSAFSGKPKTPPKNLMGQFPGLEGEELLSVLKALSDDPDLMETLKDISKNKVPSDVLRIEGPRSSSSKRKSKKKGKKKAKRRTPTPSSSSSSASLSEIGDMVGSPSKKRKNASPHSQTLRTKSSPSRGKLTTAKKRVGKKGSHSS